MMTTIIAAKEKNGIRSILYMSILYKLYRYHGGVLKLKKKTESPKYQTVETKAIFEMILHKYNSLVVFETKNPLFLM